MSDKERTPIGTIMSYSDLANYPCTELTTPLLESCERLLDEVETLQQQLTAKRAELDMITGDRDDESRLHEMTKAKLKESELKRFARFANEECWIYMDHEENHLESLVCPVVISANKLQQILSELEAKDAELGPLRRMREEISKSIPELKYFAYKRKLEGMEMLSVKYEASRFALQTCLAEWAKATAAHKRTRGGDGV